MAAGKRREIMFALYNPGYGQMGSTRYVEATFDLEEWAKAYLEALPGTSRDKYSYSIRKYDPPPHNPDPHVPKTEEERREEKIQEMEEDLARLKKQRKKRKK